MNKKVYLNELALIGLAKAIVDDGILNHSTTMAGSEFTIHGVKITVEDLSLSGYQAMAVIKVEDSEYYIMCGYSRCAANSWLKYSPRAEWEPKLLPAEKHSVLVEKWLPVGYHPSHVQDDSWAGDLWEVGSW